MVPMAASSATSTWRGDGQRHGRVPACPWRTIVYRFCLLLVLPVATACSPASMTDEQERHDRQTTPTLVGEKMYACPNGERLDADFLEDGLTLELTSLPGGRPLRLKASTTGEPFVSEDARLRLAGTDAVVITFGSAPAMTCSRTSPLAGSARNASDARNQLSPPQLEQPRSKGFPR